MFTKNQLVNNIIWIAQQTHYNNQPFERLWNAFCQKWEDSVTSLKDQYSTLTKKQHIVYEHLLFCASYQQLNNCRFNQKPHRHHSIRYYLRFSLARTNQSATWITSHLIDSVDLHSSWMTNSPDHNSSTSHGCPMIFWMDDIGLTLKRKMCGESFVLKKFKQSRLPIHNSDWLILAM